MNNERISGFTIARNVVKFGYPLEQWAQAMANLQLDEVLISYDPATSDGTQEAVEKVAQRYGFITLQSVWDMNNHAKGTELGRQTDIAASHLAYPWHLYVQLDEAFHEEHADSIKRLPYVAAEQGDIIGFDFVRIYFYGKLDLVRRDWTMPITRLTRARTHEYGSQDGMSCLPVVQGRHMLSDVPLFHYSRMGDPALVSRRIRNMDGFYHPPEELLPEQDLKAYDFQPRKWDSYLRSGPPPSVNAEADQIFARYSGTHPRPFAELYGNA